MEETSSSDVTLREIENCGDDTCVDFAEDPETLTFDNPGEQAIYVHLAASEDSSNTVMALSFDFTSN
jgi:hypothetical protein